MTRGGYNVVTPKKAKKRRDTIIIGSPLFCVGGYMAQEGGRKRDTRYYLRSSSTTPGLGYCGWIRETEHSNEGKRKIAMALKGYYPYLSLS